VCRVSVCIATYNGEKFIANQLKSILGQLSNMDEVIVSDDGSQDCTIEIIRKLNDPRIRLFFNPGEKNVNSNFENALKQAGGKYIFLSDQDDIWESNKLFVMLSYLNQYDLVVSDCSIIDKKGHCIQSSFFDLRRSGKGILKNIRANTYMGACMAFNRWILDRALPFPENIPMHDWWIGLIGDLFGTTMFCREKLVRYRRHGNNLSPLASEIRYTFPQQLNFRKNITLSLVKTWIGQNKDGT